MFSFNHDVDKISYGYMTFSCGRSGDSGTVNINVSMQLIMIFNYFHEQKKNPVFVMCFKNAVQFNEQ